MRYKQVPLAETATIATPPDELELTDAWPGFERHMQRALRQNMEQLEPKMRADDDGVERRVESGFIDITARDANDRLVVVELKTGVAGQRAVAQ